MAIRTVGELKGYLDKRKLSPEGLARETHISHMTIRRLLRRPQETAIPDRYHTQLDHHESGAVTLGLMGMQCETDFAPLLDNLYNEGQGVADLERVKAEVVDKMASPTATKTLRDFSKTLMDALNRPMSKRARAIAVGGLLYFLNPFDLIPDAIVGVGYLDDVAVMSLVSGIIARDKPEKEEAQAIATTKTEKA